MQWHAHYVSTVLGPPMEQCLYMHMYIYMYLHPYNVMGILQWHALLHTINSEASATQTPYGKTRNFSAPLNFNKIGDVQSLANINGC